MAAITLSQIDFADGDLCRPRYPFLYRYPKLPAPASIQLEPAFQIDDGVDELAVQLDLDPKAGFRFMDDGDIAGGGGAKPLCRELNNFEVPPEIEYAGESKTSCVLTWRRSPGQPATRVFRLYCQAQGGLLTDEQKVHGGLFLAFTTAPTGQMPVGIEPTKFPGLKPGSVWLLGSAASQGPVYDHFHPLTPPPGVEIEPAFRTRAGRPLHFAMVQGIRFATWRPEIKYLLPLEKPDDLDPTYTSTYYAFGWQAPSPTCPEPPPAGCFASTVVTFHLQPELPDSVPENELAAAGWNGGWPAYREAVEGIGVDPTIIQPSPCDPYFRVCYQDPGEPPAEPEPEEPPEAGPASA